MKRDIDIIIEKFEALYPAVQIEQIKVKNLGDDAGLWFFENPESPFEVQIESGNGMCPFLVETDESEERIHAHNIEDLMANLVRLLHL